MRSELRADSDISDRGRQWLWWIRIFRDVRHPWSFRMWWRVHVSQIGVIAFQIINPPFELVFLLFGMVQRLPKLVLHHLCATVVLFKLMDPIPEEIVYDFKLADARFECSVLLLQNLICWWRLEVTIIQRGCGARRRMPDMHGRQRR